LLMPLFSDLCLELPWITLLCKSQMYKWLLWANKLNSDSYVLEDIQIDVFSFHSLIADRYSVLDILLICQIINVEFGLSNFQTSLSSFSQSEWIIIKLIQWQWERQNIDFDGPFFFGHSKYGKNATGMETMAGHQLL
jgi:hypothetical protein